MQNINQTANNGQQWTNQAFASLFDSITSKLPNLTFWAIIFAYIATAGLNCYAIHLPIYLSVPLSLAIQSLRFLCVFTPFLNPSGRASHLPELIAVGASLLALFELSFSLQALGEVDANFWSLFLFGAAILVLSMVLELQFISAGKRAFGLTAQKVTGGGAVSMVNQQQPATSTPLPADPAPDVQAYQDEIEFLKNQLAAQQPAMVGNGSAKPGRPKKQIPSDLLNGHSSNGNGNGKH
jgi:hypothetical protein